MYLWLSSFNRPVAFYAYTSWVTNPILDVDDSYRHLSDDDKDVIEYIEHLRSLVAKLRRRNDYCSTSKDNKTVIEVKDHDGNSLFFGMYDSKYWIGLGVRSEFKNPKIKIDLSDVSMDQWHEIAKQLRTSVKAE